MQNRFRSKYAWTALLALMAFVVKNYIGFEIRDIDKLIDLLLVTASAFGIFKNPTDSEKY